MRTPLRVVTGRLLVCLLTLSPVSSAMASVCAITLPDHGPVDSTPDPDRLAAARALQVRLDSAGNPSATGLKCIPTFGMSTMADYSGGLRTLIRNVWPMAPGVKFVIGAVSGKTVRFWDERTDSQWTGLKTKLANAGCSPLQVILGLGMITQESPAIEGAMTAGEIAGVVDAFHFHFPNAALLLSGHPFTGYLDPAFATKVPEPFIYQDSVLLRDELAVPQLYPVILRDKWTNGPNANGFAGGLTWLCSDVKADGHHPIPGVLPNATYPDGTGALKLATIELRWWQQVFPYDAVTGIGLVHP